MRKFSFGLSVTAVVVAMLGIACSASSEDPPAVDPSWAEAKSTLGVTYWESDESSQITGYDDAHQVRAQFVVEHTQDADGNDVVRIKSVVQGPAVLEFRPLPDKTIAIVQDTFKDHPDAQKAFSIAEANLKAQAAVADAPLTNSSLHVLDNGGSSSGQLVGNQQQLICKDSRGRACEAPPSGVATVRDCVIGAGGLFGLGCLTSGAETVGVGCVVSAVAAVGGGLICADDVAQRAGCHCETPCAAQCHQTYNRQYMCGSNNTRPCSDAVANDRRQEAACVSGCGGG